MIKTFFLDMSEVIFLAQIFKERHNMIVRALIARLSASPRVQELMINGPNLVFIESEGKVLQLNEPLTEKDLQDFVDSLPRENDPFLNCTLNQARVHVVLPPISQSPLVTVRFFQGHQWSWEECATHFDLGKTWSLFFNECVESGLNILVAGATSTGKTTFLSALLTLVADDQRIIAIEDTPEIQTKHPHFVGLNLRDLKGAREEHFSEALRESLRMRPDRLLLGEIRGGEAFDFVQLMHTGHCGAFATMHAFSATDALLRLETLAQLSRPHINKVALKRMLSEGPDLVVFLRRDHNLKRTVAEVLEVTGLLGETISLQTLCERDEKGLLQATKVTPKCWGRLEISKKMNYEEFLNSKRV
jgi:pilus assembly protein CpaF